MLEKHLQRIKGLELKMEEMNQIIKNLQEELHDERDKNQGMAIECH